MSAKTEVNTMTKNASYNQNYVLWNAKCIGRQLGNKTDRWKNKKEKASKSLSRLKLTQLLKVTLVQFHLETHRDI